ncbi:MAG: FkbM family methyltransferase [Solirubrobacteraceae bacterium]
MIKDTALKIRSRLWARQLPKIITVTDFNPDGVRYEASSVSELHRILNRGWEHDYLREMLAALEPGDVLYDIGANIGLVALHAAAICSTVAFEPDPDTFGRLERNRELNRALSVSVRRLAVSDEDRVVTLFTDGVEGTSASLVHQRREEGAVEVQARTLDSMAAEGALPRPTVIKLDIEGAEILALRGGRELLTGENAPRLLLLEVHDAFLPGFGSSADEVREIATEAGFTRVIYESKRAREQHLILGRALTGSASA